MKKTLLIAALTMMSATAFASKARLSALSNSPHLTDVQNVFAKPNQLHSVGEQATFEMGATTATGLTAGAEGGFVKKGEMGTWGFYLGHKATSMVWAWSVIGTASFEGEQNPFDVSYASEAGDMKYGVNFHYSNSDKKSTSIKTNSMGLTAGVQSGAWDAQLGLGLAGGSTNSATTGTDVKMTMTSAMQLTGGYNMDSMYIFGDYTSLGAKKETGTTENNKPTRNDMAVGVVNSMKKDGADFYYGAKYLMRTDKDAATAVDTKTESTQLPVWIGVEAEAASWLALRASISQNVLLGSTKGPASTAQADTIANNTTVAAGLGLKFGKFMLDGTIQNANAGTGTFGLDGANFITNTSMTYTF